MVEIQISLPRICVSAFFPALEYVEHKLNCWVTDLAEDVRISTRMIIKLYCNTPFFPEANSLFRTCC